MRQRISAIMSHVSFDQIFCLRHLADLSLQIPPGQPGYDKLFKVHCCLDLVLPQLEAQYTLHQSVTVDEAMIPFRGWLSYIKRKPTKWGIKAFALLMQQTAMCIACRYTMERLQRPNRQHVCVAVLH